MTTPIPTERIPPPPPPTPSPIETGLNGKIALFGYFCLCLNALFFSYLCVGFPWWARDTLMVEDGLVENLTAVWFLLAGILLFATALVERNFFRRCLYILGGLAMVFFCGEEISWGQRIFGFATPDFLMGLNPQGEFNIHNIYFIALPLLYMVVGAAFFMPENKIFGIPLPSIPLALGFLVLAEEQGLLFVAIYALLSRQGRLFMITVATAALIVLPILSIDVGIGRPEMREYLFGIVSLFYSLELLLAQERLAAISWVRPFTELKMPDRRSCRLTIASLFILLIGASIGLVFFGYDTDRVRTATLMETYRSVQSAEPVIRSTFDVYLMRNRLIYVKEPCDPADTRLNFFLHIIPADANDLPQHRRPHGFDNRDFWFGMLGNGIAVDGKCLMTRPLPDYKIARVETGQFIRKKKGKPWVGTFTLNE